jgi:hypothetical protein
MYALEKNSLNEKRNKFDMKKYLGNRGTKQVDPPASAGFLLVLHFKVEHEGDMFLRNVRFSPNHTVLQSRRFLLIPLRVPLMSVLRIRHIPGT